MPVSDTPKAILNRLLTAKTSVAPRRAPPTATDTASAEAIFKIIETEAPGYAAKPVADGGALLQNRRSPMSREPLRPSRADPGKGKAPENRAHPRVRLPASRQDCRLPVRVR